MDGGNATSVSLLSLARVASEAISELVIRIPLEDPSDDAEACALCPSGSADRNAVELLSAEIEQIVRRTSALSGVHAAARADEFVAAGRSPGSAAVEVAEEMGVERGEARTRVERGRRADSLEGRALAAGEITERQERACAALRDSAADYLSEENIEQLIAELLDECGHKSSTAITRRGYKRLAILSPQWARDRQRRLHRDRGAYVSNNPDGSRRLTVTLDPRSHAIVAAAMARYARPGCLVGMYDSEGTLLFDGTHATMPHRSSDGVPYDAAQAARDAERLDERTSAQRNFDALLYTLIRGLQVEGTRPGGVASIVVRLSPEDLDHPERLVDTDAGAQVSVREAVAMAEGNPWFLSHLAHGVENLHRIDVDAGAEKRRTASALQRVVMYAAHGGCTCPDCEVPAAACQAHHIQEWWKGGRTELGNLTFACTAHHARVGDGPGQWSTTPVEGHPGLARWQRHPHEDMAS